MVFCRTRLLLEDSDAGGGAVVVLGPILHVEALQQVGHLLLALARLCQFTHLLRHQLHARHKGTSRWGEGSAVGAMARTP